MTTIFAPTALLPGGWARDVRVTLDGARIAAVAAGAPARAGDRMLDDCALVPAMPNLHSHAFQRAMAGMTARRGPGDDSFWTWRALMYRFLDALTPDDVEAIAALAYMEMLEAGYASVGEFHYLHQRPGGGAYDDPAEMSGRIAAAAGELGIGLTLLPVLYCHGSPDGRPLAGGQLRFGNDLEAFLRLVEAARSALPVDAVLGAAAHSLRSVPPEQVTALAGALPEGPLHIHAAEQTREVEEIQGAFGARPVELLLDRVGIGPRWCVVHATHMTEAETAGLARSGAVAGLCPITEADLGDGVFDAPRYLAAGGAFGIGTDSNLRVALGDELRTLEYGQRLTRRARNVLAAEGASVGETLFAGALTGGARALHRECGAIRAGALADLAAIDRSGAALAPLADGQLLDGWVFAADDRVVREVWSAGRHVVREGRHVARDAVAARYRRTMTSLLARI